MTKPRQIGSSYTQRSRGNTPGAGGGVVIPSTDFAFLAANFGIALTRQGGSVAHNYVPANSKRTPTVTYYWDMNAANDAGAGTSWGTARKTLGGVRSLVNNIVVGGIAEVRFRNMSGFQRRTASLTLTRSHQFVSDDGSHSYTVMAVSETPPTWAKTPGFTNVYEFASTTASARMMDMGLTYAEYPSQSGKAYPAWAPRYRRLEAVASIALVDLTPGSFFHDAVTSKKYVNTFDSRPGDDNVVEVTQSNGFGFVPPATVLNPFIWAENLHIVGGPVGFSLSELVAAGGSGGIAAYRAYLHQCSISCTSDDGLRHEGLGSALLYRFAAYDTDLDGIAIYGLNAPTNTDPTGDLVEIECVTDNCGRGTSTATNSSTLHSMGRAVTVGCDYRNALDRNVHDVNAAKRWALGTIFGPSRQASGATSRSLQAGNASAQSVGIWVDSSCSFLPGSLYTLNTFSGCVIHGRNAVLNGLPVDPASAGTIDTYTV